MVCTKIRTKLLSWLSTFVYTFTFFLASFIMWMPPAQADCYFIIFCSSNKSSFQSKGGVRRGPCAAIKEALSLIALAPEKKPGQPAGGYPTTVQDYPTFWFYLPPYQASIKSAKFVLLDEQNHLVQDPIFVQMPETLPAIAGLTLPSTGKDLEVGKHYSWHFSLNCEPQKPSRNPEVIGQIQRALPGPLPRAPEPGYLVHDNTYIGQSTPENTAWFDTVDQLIKKRTTYSSDWSTLLSKLEISNVGEVVELRHIDKPIENCTSQGGIEA